MLHRLALLARVDARRPAAWLALVAAALVAGLLPETACAGRPAPAVAAVVLGAVLAVMALGDAVPTDRASAGGAFLIVARVAWPLIGWGVAAALRAELWLVPCGGIGIVAGAGLRAALVGRDLLAADAASVALVGAGFAGAVGWSSDESWPTRGAGGTVAAVVLVGLMLGAGAWRGRRRMARASSLAAVPSLRYRARRLLTAAAMVAAMAGMVGWLFLATGLATLDLAASLAWFTALAVPAAALGDGVSHGTVWRRLERAAPHGTGRHARLAPGRLRDGVLATLTAAAMLGWPPLVAALLWGADVTRSVPAAVVVTALAAAAVVLLVVVVAGDIVTARPDTVQAIALAGACLATTAMLLARCGGPPFLPLPSFPGW